MPFQELLQEYPGIPRVSPRIAFSLRAFFSFFKIGVVPRFLNCIFASWISTNVSGQIILRNFGEFYIALFGLNNRTIFVIVESNICQGAIWR